MIEQIGFIGLGLIGGSLAKAIKRYHLSKYIVAYDVDSRSLELAHKEGVIDKIAPSIDDSFQNCSLVFLCCPVHINMEVYKKLISIVNKSCIITDVGSTKADMVEYITDLGAPLPFIGGHPMVGSEKNGYKASSSHLFENVYYLLTPLENTPSSHTERLITLIKAIQGLPISMEPSQHDFITACISHVPHIIASSLVNLVKELDTNDAYLHTLAAGGFKDITRIASSSPIMWQQICLTNPHYIIQVLRHYIGSLEGVIHSIEETQEDNLYHFFEEARSYRESFQEKGSGTFVQAYRLSVDIVDEPGMIANIATLLSEHRINIKNIGIINNREYTNGVLEIIFYDEEDLEKSIKLLSEKSYLIYRH